jgi:serine/threonine protein kinase
MASDGRIRLAPLMLAAGTTVEGYRIEGLLGEGGMATVYKARQASLNRVVALKIVARRVGEDAAFRERFQRECEIQAGLDHPNIVPVYEAGESEHGLWLTMRLVRGPTLRELLIAENLSPERALELLTPIARALDVAHETGLIHRDITPQNILIDERGHPYLSDFGITKGRGDRSLTRTGQFVGTLDYVAPEQIRDEPSGTATDTYALTAILFECLTGRVPFDKGNEAAVLYAHISEDPPRASEIDSSLPAALDPVLEKGLAKQPADRYAKASDLIAAAEEALQGDSGEPEALPLALPARRNRGLFRSRPEPERQGIPLRRALSLALLALLLAAAALAAGAISSGDSNPDSRRVDAGDLELDLPQGWIAVKGKRSGIPGLPLKDPLALAPRGRLGREAVVVGVSSASGRTLLPTAFRQTLAGRARGTPVSLGSLEALRYLGLRQRESADRLTAFVSPTDAGVATLVCRPSKAGTEFPELCQRLASSLELTRGKAFPLGPSPLLAVALRRQLAALAERRTALRRKLGAAGSAARQAAAATGLAAAFRRAARSLSALRVTPQSAAALAALVEALRSTRDSYKLLATAARQEDAGAYNDAVARVNRSEAAVDRRLLALRQLGYQVGPAE